MKTTLKVKDWLKERSEKPQFEFIMETLVRRINDGKKFIVGQISGTNIKKFHEDLINVTATTWVDTSSGGFYGTFTVPINHISNDLAVNKKNDSK